MRPFLSKIRLGRSEKHLNTSDEYTELGVSFCFVEGGLEGVDFINKAPK